MTSIEIMISNKLGLHARASSKFVMCASKYNCNISISKGQSTANAKSIVSVMMLAANNGSTVILKADGENEEQAIADLVNLINSKFGEEE